LLLFSTETLLFTSCIKNKDKNIQKYNFTCCFVQCETWSLSPWEEHTLSVFQNRVVRGIFQSKSKGIRKLYEEELYILYSSSKLWGWSNQGEWDGWVM